MSSVPETSSLVPKREPIPLQDDVDIDSPHGHAVDAEAGLGLVQTFFRYNNLNISPIFASLISECLDQLLASAPQEAMVPIPDLLTTSTPLSYHVGTGRQILNHVFHSILTGPESVTHELLFVTCFWANSASLGYLSKTLLELNRLNATSSGGYRRGKLRIRICVSSTSLFQKLLHTSSSEGYTYPNTAVAYRRLGIPPPDQLKNLDVIIKSKFFRPISVLHGKFVIVDRKRLYLPSCNVSWEEWLEGMGVFEGSIVNTFLKYYQQVWGDCGEAFQGFAGESATQVYSEGAGAIWSPTPPPPISVQFSRNAVTPTIFLPQPHHPVFPPLFLVPKFVSNILSTCLPFQISPNDQLAPATAQNTFMSGLIRQAQNSVFIQTPNLTSPYLLEVLYERLIKPGQPIHIEILTSKRMMVVEQIVTTGFGGPSGQWGATTEACIRKLLQRLKGNINPLSDLHIDYYAPLSPTVTDPDKENLLTAQEEMELARQSHVKVMIVDHEATVVGSANGDRASWYTSGEVNLLVFDTQFAQGVRGCLEKGVGSRRVRVELNNGTPMATRVTCE